METRSCFNCGKKVFVLDLEVQQFEYEDSELKIPHTVFRCKSNQVRFVN